MKDEAPLTVSLGIGDATLAERVGALLRQAGLRVAAAGETADLIIVEPKRAGRAAEAGVRTPVERASFDALLTHRELEVLRLLAEGASNKTIARRLGISAHTAKFHVGRLLDKLDATGRADAVVHAARLGVLHL